MCDGGTRLKKTTHVHSSCCNSGPSLNLAPFSTYANQILQGRNSFPISKTAAPTTATDTRVSTILNQALYVIAVECINLLVSDPGITPHFCLKPPPRVSPPFLYYYDSNLFNVQIGKTPVTNSRYLYSEISNTSLLMFQLQFEFKIGATILQRSGRA